MTLSFQFINGYKQFEGDSFTGDGSHVCGYFSWGWKHYITKNDCISVIIDSDMFFVKDISIEEQMKGYNFAIVPHTDTLESIRVRKTEDRSH